jgi:hypothetical protein
MHQHVAQLALQGTRTAFKRLNRRGHIISLVRAPRVMFAFLRVNPVMPGLILD